MHASVTKQYNLVPAKGRWCLVAGKVTGGLASHWPHVTDVLHLQVPGNKEMSTGLHCVSGLWWSFPLPYERWRCQFLGVAHADVAMWCDFTSSLTAAAASLRVVGDRYQMRLWLTVNYSCVHVCLTSRLTTFTGHSPHNVSLTVRALHTFTFTQSFIVKLL